MALQPMPDFGSHKWWKVSVWSEIRPRDFGYEPTAWELEDGIWVCVARHVDLDDFPALIKSLKRERDPWFDVKHLGYNCQFNRCNADYCECHSYYAQQVRLRSHSRQVPWSNDYWGDPKSHKTWSASRLEEALEEANREQNYAKLSRREKGRARSLLSPSSRSDRPGRQLATTR